MTPAEKRIKELIDRWVTSIELHLQYAELSDDAYWKIQAWPKHDRPTRWVLESAKQKANELRDVFESRHGMGDSRFADALELMSFLANLVGAQHVDRFIPLAEPRVETTPTKPKPPPPVLQSAPPQPTPRTPPPAQQPTPPPAQQMRAPPTSDMPSWYMQAQAAQQRQTPPQPQVSRPAPAPIASPPPPKEVDPDATREMPWPNRQPQAAASIPKIDMPRRAANDPDATREMPKVRASAGANSAKSDPPKKQGSAKVSSAPAKQNSKAAPAPNAEQQTVINDAVRLLGWGRTWHELAELIARMADRPSVAEIRKILRAHRTTIEKNAKG